MKTLQIACVPTNWDKSTITATGLMRNGRAALPKSIVANDLPAEWFAVWRGIVASLQTLDPNGWAASFISVVKEMKYPEINIDPEADPETPVEMPEPVPYLNLTIYRRWDDRTTAEPLTLPIEEPVAVSLFDYLTENE